MNKKFTSIIIAAIFFAMVFGIACSGSDRANVENNQPSPTDQTSHTDQTSPTDQKSQTDMRQSNEREALTGMDQDAVEGAILGSRSSHVRDREFWKDLDDESLVAAGKDLIYGVHLPEFLLTSSDAMKANEELIEFSKDLLKAYKENKTDEMKGSLPMQANFSVYDDGELVSVHIESANMWEGYYNKHLIYNFLIPDKNSPDSCKLISDEELLKHLGINPDEMMAMMEATIQRDYARWSDLYDSQVEDISFLSGMDYYEGVALNDFWDSYKERKNRIYIDPSGRANLIYTQHSETGRGLVEVTSPLAGVDNAASEISPAFIQTAKALGVNPNEDGTEAFVISVGGAYDDASLQAMLGALYPWQIVFTNYEDPKLLPLVKMDEENYQASLLGQEFYLIIPKYKSTTTSIQELELSNEGQLKEIANDKMDQTATSGTTLIAINISEIAPNARVILRHRDEKIEFSPSISLKDGSLYIDGSEKIKDASSILEKIPGSVLPP